MTIVCINRPNRSKPRFYTERDVGRIIAYARQDGANDAKLIAQILGAFGQKELGCAIFRILDVLNTAIFLGAILGILKGVLTLLKGIKIIATGKKSRIVTSVLEFVIPKKFIDELAVLLLFIGATETAFSALIIFITGIANNVAIYLLAKGVCDTFVEEFTVPIEKLDLGDVSDVLELSFSELFDLIVKGE